MLAISDFYTPFLQLQVPFTTNEPQSYVFGGRNHPLHISSQKKLLTKAAKEKGYTHLVHFYDDGISGVTMDRPEFNRMMEQLELGKAGAVFVKDLSRLGRNYIEVGRLTDEFFPEHNIRLVAVSDNIDTDEGESEFAPIKNLFNATFS